MIEENVSLKAHNTFGVEAQARYFAEANTIEKLEAILSWYRGQPDLELLILGGGSNVLFTRDWPGLVLRLNLTGKKVVDDHSNPILVEAMAGENWHEFVMWTLDQGFNGLENMALIPGNVGASPMQNIGAYGVEVKDRFWCLEALNIETGALETFTAKACEFGYRESVFKKAEKGKWIIVSVTFALSRSNEVQTDYGTIQKTLAAHGITTPTPLQVAQAVTAIRSSKLPDPKVLGSAGSFFKNPVISMAALKALQTKLPEVPFYQVSAEAVKIPAGYLIDQAGWKGKRLGSYGVHEHQALVLVNYGGATGQEIWDLAQAIQSDILDRYDLELTPEVNVI